MQSGEVDVVSETGLTGSIEEPKQRHAFFSTGSSADDNDDAMMRLRRREMQKVVPVAREEYGASLVGKPENGLIRRIARKCLTQQRDFVAELLQQIAQVVGDIMVQQELHSDADAICRATSKSISPRWSS
jgi:hypothetical protein